MKTIAAVLFMCMMGVSYAHTSYPKDVKCPIDGEKFKIMVTMSYTTFKTYHDFQKEGAIGDLYESEINSCPKCHYCGYEDDIDTTFTEAVKQEILTVLEPYKKMKMNDVLECEIAAQIQIRLGYKNDVIANTYLVASYLLKKEKSQSEKRKEFQKQSLNYYLKALEKKEYEKKESYATMYYLVGELCRRVGDFENAVRYFDMAINNPDKKDWVQGVAEEQKTYALKKDDDNSL